ncbi:MAG: DUF1837 domain-containing protein [Devosia sp.]
MAEHLFQWLPYIALSQDMQSGFGSDNFVEMLRLAAAHIYKTRRTDTRGELGELLLHIACISEFETVPIICKLVLKTSSNDTVKGFDGIHLLRTGAGFEIWLGESKFYTNPKDAITDAISSVRTHLLPTFLDTEKAMIFGHVAPDVPHRDEVLALFKSTTSGDKLLEMAAFPILIAYDSDAVGSFDKLCDEYTKSIAAEVEGLRSFFAERVTDLRLRFHLVFVPLNKKKDLVEKFDQLLVPFL